MKLHVYLNGPALMALMEKDADAEEKPDHLGNTVAAIVDAGLKPANRQHLMNNFMMLLGDGDEKTVKAVRKIPNVVKIRRADGGKLRVK